LLALGEKQATARGRLGEVARAMYNCTWAVYGPYVLNPAAHEKMNIHKAAMQFVHALEIWLKTAPDNRFSRSDMEECGL
jgi:hypothetical protein